MYYAIDVSCHSYMEGLLTLICRLGLPMIGIVDIIVMLFLVPMIFHTTL